MKYALPKLPQPFCENAISLRPSLDPALVPLDAALSPGAIEAAIAGSLAKWGPGDYRAATSLWTQGYFARLLRPALAYGLLRDTWFDLAFEKV